MANGNVQRPSGGVVTDFGLGEDSTTVTVNSVATANSFARITNSLYQAGGPTAGDGAARRNNDDLSCTCLLTDATTVTLTRQAAGADEDVSVAFEVIEFPGTGNDAAIVRMHQNITLVDTDPSIDTAIPGVTTIGDCVPIICGISLSNTSEQMDRGAVSAQIVDVSGAKIRLTRGDQATEVIVSVAVVEFTGSNWSVQGGPGSVISHTQTTIDSTETESCSAVNWAETMIFSSLETDSANIDAIIGVVWPGSSTTTVRFYVGDLSPTIYVYLVSNSNLVVEHIDSVTGAESAVLWTSADPSTKNKTVSSSVLADHFVIATFYNTIASGAGSLGCWNYYLTSTTNLRFWVYQGNSSSFDIEEWAAQLIDISGLTEVVSKEVTIGLLTETDLAQSLGKAKARAIGLLTETNLSQTFGSSKSKQIGLVSETELAQVFGAAKALAIGLTTETDFAQPLVTPQSINIGLVSESEVSQAFSALKQRAVGLLTEANLAQVFSKSKSKQIGLTSESDLSQVFSKAKPKAIGLVSEIELAQTFSTAKALAIGIVTETELAQTIGRTKAKVVGLLSETDQVFAFDTVGLTVNMGLVLETDIVQTLGKTKDKAIGLLTETDLAPAVSPAKSTPLGLITEFDIPFALGTAKLRSIGLIAEFDAPLAFAVKRGVDIGLLLETDTVFAMSAARALSLGLVSESDIVFSMSSPSIIVVTNLVQREARFQVKLRRDVGFAQTDKRDVRFQVKLRRDGLFTETLKRESKFAQSIKRDAKF